MANFPPSKQLVRAALAGRTTARPPFVPWIGRYAARVEQVSVQEMMADAQLLVRALDNARRLFDCDAIVVGFDPTLEAEACGCTVEWTEDGAAPIVASHALVDVVALGDAAIDGIGDRGRLPVVLEAARRLIATSGRNTAIIAHVTGPLTLASHLLGRDAVEALAEPKAEAELALDAAGKVAAKTCRLYADLSVDAVVIAEDSLSRSLPDLISSRLKRSLQQALNVAKYYNIGTIILCSGAIDGAQARAVCALGASAAVLGGGLDNGIVAEHRRIAFGRAVPLAILADKAAISATLPGLLAGEEPTWRFLTTEWEIPFETPVDNLHEVARIYREYVASRCGE